VKPPGAAVADESGAPVGDSQVGNSQEHRGDAPLESLPGA
jgi:hypothetical protein